MSGGVVDAMPPPPQASPSSSRPRTNSKLANGSSKTPKPTSRPSSAASQSISATPRSQQGTAASQMKSIRTRADSVKDKEGRPSTRHSAKRESNANQILAAGGARTRPPFKDGTAQRAAKEVAGLKDYQLGVCLGRGAFGSVYCALNWGTGETVAIKQIRLADLPRPELPVIMQEIDLLKNLHHPNIVKYHGSSKTSDSLYIILEYCENGSLHKFCKDFGKFPENLVSLYTAQVLRGLVFLHEQGVIHRDIKGANILTTKEGLVKLADFGVATKQQGLAEGSVVGTPYWMAPEVIELAGATTASDIWSLGCTVIELLDGKPPYHKLAPMPALFRIVNDDNPPIPDGISPLVRDFLLQCFQKDPNLRVTAKKLLKHPWIVSSQKSEPKKPEYNEAVKVVKEWNEALKSSPPNTLAAGSPNRRSAELSNQRPTSSRASRATGSRRDGAGHVASGSSGSAAHMQTKSKPSAPPVQQVQNENWDNDFEAVTADLEALRLPDHRKPHDNFAGQFTSEKLKRYARAEPHPETDGKVEMWDHEFEGDLTVRSPMQLDKGDAIETVRPFYPAGTTNDDIKHKIPLTVEQRPASTGRKERRASRDSQPNTQILRPMPDKKISKIKTGSTPVPKKVQNAVATKDRYKESDEEDYSDLISDSDESFQRKLAAFKPSAVSRPEDLRNLPNVANGRVQRRTRTPTSLFHDAAAMRRNRSSLEIQKYAEHEDDADFTDIDLGNRSVLKPVKARSLASTSTDSESSGSGTYKLSSSAVWTGDEDEDDEDDPFAALEKEIDEADLQSNVARDKYARLCTLVEGLVSDLKLTQPEDVLAQIADDLLRILADSPDVRSVIVSSHGMLPILEILDTCTRSNTILMLLKIVNIIVKDDVEFQENLCFVGGIPIICEFTHKKFATEIRLEAAEFVRMILQTSTLTLQMFISSGGLNVLVEFLEEDYASDAGRELVLIGVNGVWMVFELQGPTPKNDFCRIFSRSSVLYPLSLVLSRVLCEQGELAQLVQGRIVNIFLIFSQAENHVKEIVADRMVLKRVLKDLGRMRPQHQITMLKFIKNLSMLPTTLDALQNSNAIESLTELLAASMNEEAQFREIGNQVLNTMYNLCRLSKARQEDAALSGVIPLLQRILLLNLPLKEFALPILFDMAHSGKIGRRILWQHKGLQSYIELVSDAYWCPIALDAIFIWLQEETAKVEELLLSSPDFGRGVLKCFESSRADRFESALEPLQKLLRLSPPLSASLADRTLFERTIPKFHMKKPLARLNMLRVIRSICDAAADQGNLLAKFGLLESIQGLVRHDPAILVREMANDLIKSSEVSATSMNRYGAVRRSSSAAMPSPLFGPHSSVSVPPTPGERGGAGQGYFDLAGIEMARSSRAMASSPYLPLSREPSHMSTPTSGQHSTITREGRMAPPTRSSTSNLHRIHSRLSIVPNSTLSDPTKERDIISPTHAPPSANTRSSTAAQARRRRQTSGAELGR